MYATYHGGGCCGITHIAGFGAHPKWTCSKQINPSKIEGEYEDDRQNYFYYQLPEQPVLDRLDDLIECVFYPYRAPVHKNTGLSSTYLDLVRGGIIEAVLNRSQAGNGWEEELFKRKFRKVSEVKNRNSNNVIYVYHLYVDDYVAE